MKSAKSISKGLPIAVSWRATRLFLVWCAAVCLQLSSPVAADSIPTVTTDKPDYPPGDTAQITGSGFQAGEEVECQVLRLDNPFDPNIEHLPWLVAVDASGNFQTSWYVTSDAAGATLELTAVGQTSRLVASVMFTDSPATCPAPPRGTAPVNPPAGGFAIDGDLQANTPDAGLGDWLPGPTGSGGNVMTSAGVPLDSTTTLHLTDGYGGPDNNFQSGLKVDGNPNGWSWLVNPVNDKQDINNALIHIRTDANGHRWIVLAADRKSNNGDSYVDFEFLQNTLTINTTGTDSSGNPYGTFTSTGPDGGRTVNDFLLTVTFTKGGTTPGVCLSRWLPASSGFDYFDATASLPAGSIFGAVNTVESPAPYGAFGGSTYPVNTFAEVAVDVTALMAGFDPCLSLGVRTIMVKTKESQSPTATIVDFIAPLTVDLKVGPTADAGPDQVKCTEGASTAFTMNGAAYAGIGPITTTNWTVVSGSATIDSPGSLTTTVHVSSSSATLRLNVADLSPCNKTDDVVLTVNPPPSCSISGAAPVCPSSANTYSGPAGMASYAWSISGNGTIVGSTSGQSVSVTAGTGCSQNFTLTLTVASAIGCSSTCQKDFMVSDTSAPTIQSAPAGGDLGCNPLTLPSDASVMALVTAHDDCASSPTINVSHVDGGTACAPTRTFTITATDGCNNTSDPTTVVYSWKSDTTKPTITSAPAGGVLGCNPGNVPTDAGVKAQVTAHDDCASTPTINVSHVDGGTVCAPTRTFTITATDGCKTPSDATTVVSKWKADTTKPTITSAPAGGDLGCNPGSLPSDDSVKAQVIASDTCTASPSINVTHVDGGTACAPTRTFTITETDGCNNTSDATTVVYSWKADTTKPTITSAPAGGDLGCNPGSLRSDDRGKAQVIASDTCTASPSINVTHVDGGTACAPTRTFTITATDGCNNTSDATTVVYSWKADTTKPTTTSAPAGGDLGCNPGLLPSDDSVKAQVIAGDTCTASPSINVTHVDGGTACAPTRTFTITATDGCNNTSDATTVVYSWKADTTKPTTTSAPAGGDLGCNPGLLPSDDSVKAQVIAGDTCTASPSINVTHVDGGT